MSAGRVRPESGLNLREKPNGKRIAVLGFNAEVAVLDEVRFLRVKTSDGRVGYVHANYIDESYGTGFLDSGKVMTGSLPSPAFKMTRYIGKNYLGKEVIVDEDFVPLLEKLDRYASRKKIKIWVTSSLRNLDNQINGAIVTPAKKSCHHVGHAIDMNLQFEGQLYNSKKLSVTYIENLPKQVRCFIDYIRSDNYLRWGGDFSTPDPVHIDDNLYRRHKLIYLSKLQSRVEQLNA